MQNQTLLPPPWRSDTLRSALRSTLPVGWGRSYGDSCLNEDGFLIPTTNLDHLISFDIEQGVLRAEAGVSFDQILRVIVPQGWFLPVVPGTKYITLGGAIANDVHGKNHHRAGTFGRHVTRFELLRSDGTRHLCTPQDKLFTATIGGLGLTGLITWAEIKLTRIKSAYLEVENLRFRSLDEFFKLSEQSHNWDYCVAWIDCFANFPDRGRGIFMRGQFSTRGELKIHRDAKLQVPIDAPGFVLGGLSMRAFNLAFYHKPLSSKLTHYDPYFFPLDSVRGWNRLYGKRGFLQYQLVLPFAADRSAITRIFGKVKKAGQGSFLAVLKTFGDQPSPGLLSFPRAGVTLCLDFPLLGERTFSLLNDLDQVVREAGGRLYPAKDARMSPHDFQIAYPQWRELERARDPQMNSSFWRRVTCPTS